MSQFINPKLFHLYNFFQKRGFYQEANLILKQASSFVVTKFLDTTEHPPMLRYDIHLDEKNVAYAVVNPKSSEGDGPWIGGIWVSQEHRGKGLVKLLLQHIEKDFKGQVLRLRAKPYKDKAVSVGQLIQMYQKLGFEPYDNEGRMLKRL